MKKKTWVPLNFESDLDHRLDTKNHQRSRFFPHLLIIMCLGEGLHSLSAVIPSVEFVTIFQNSNYLEIQFTIFNVLKWQVILIIT